MEADSGFLSRRRMAVEVEVDAPRGDGGGVATGVTGGGAAEIRWRGSRVLNTGGFFGGGGGGGGFSPRTAAAAGMEPDFASTPHRTRTPTLTPPPELCASTSASSPEEYESLPRGVPTTTHMMAGAVAGVMEHCVMFPVDCVKVPPPGE